MYQRLDLIVPSISNQNLRSNTIRFTSSPPMCDKGFIRPQSLPYWANGDIRAKLLFQSRDPGKTSCFTLNRLSKPPFRFARMFRGSVKQINIPALFGIQSIDSET